MGLKGVTATAQAKSPSGVSSSQLSDREVSKRLPGITQACFQTPRLSPDLCIRNFKPMLLSARMVSMLLQRSTEGNI